MKKAVIIFIIFIIVLLGGMAALSFVDVTIPQTAIEKEVHIES